MMFFAEAIGNETLVIKLFDHGNNIDEVDKAEVGVGDNLDCIADNDSSDDGESFADDISTSEEFEISKEYGEEILLNIIPEEADLSMFGISIDSISDNEQDGSLLLMTIALLFWQRIQLTLQFRFAFPAFVHLACSLKLFSFLCISSNANGWTIIFALKLISGECFG